MQLRGRRWDAVLARRVRGRCGEMIWNVEGPNVIPSADFGEADEAEVLVIGVDTPRKDQSIQL